MPEIIEAVEGSRGYWVGPGFTEKEILSLCGFVENQMLCNIEAIAPKQLKYFTRAGLRNYHAESYRIDHASVWPRHVRLMNADCIEFIQQTSFYKRLGTEFGKPIISSEVEGGKPEVVWRLVRPGEQSDVGPLHADSWFWKINGWSIPSGCRCIKVWVLVSGEEEQGGLRVVSGSHQGKNWKFGVERRHGMGKPTFDEAQVSAESLVLKTPPGTAVVFSYDLLHAGIASSGGQSRVSIEFTVFVPEPVNNIGQ